MVVESEVVEVVTEWQKRKSSLIEAIDAVKRAVDSQNSAGEYRYEVVSKLSELLLHLKTFGEGHFNYFHDLFVDPSKESKDYPPEYVYSLILDQISFDLTVIEQAANQRLSQSPKLYNTLKKADGMAKLALAPAFNDFELGDTIFITYFQKSASIRVIPYASVALIGIPYTTLTESRDFLAIPHEVGHYLYWRGEVNGRSLQQVLTQAVSKNTDWFDWLEEIFADVFGCLVAGPVIALSFQDLQLRRTPADFIEDDGEHPVPILRPNIYTQVLKEFFGNNWGSNLDLRWNGDGTSTGKGKRHKRAENNELKFRDKQDQRVNKPVNEIVSTRAASKDRDSTGKSIDIMVDKILATLSSKNADKLPPRSAQDAWWLTYLRTANSVETLYNEFASQVQNYSAEEVTLGSLNPKTFNELLPGWVALGKQLRNPQRNPEWLPILHAGGWVTRGPICEGSGTCD
ncbi:hypothetical protein [Candidatus Leptofilum sp.]|uniref:hypothetical protein n=1 Tax=Candidatus Leptofilum sp. TaxID=3241576 RepID=UPI003B5C5621